MSALKKNAGFYLKRVNDPPHDFVKAVRELQAEAQSRRIVTTSLEGLFRALQCEVSGADYDEDRHATICDLLSLLTYYKLRLVPPSVPCDLEYDDPVFLSCDPDLTNDEDIAYVTNLVKSGRKPVRSDLAYITRMNEKMAAYNVLLRVFEAMFVIRRSPLGPHQRMFINNLLSEMPLPQEGRSYLKACYTYVSQYASRRCDFTCAKGHLKALDDEKTKQICTILAEIYARGGTREPLDPTYPHIEMLKAECTKTSVPVAQRDFFSADEAFTELSQSVRRTSFDKRMSPTPAPDLLRKKAKDQDAEHVVHVNKAMQAALNCLLENTALHEQIFKIIEDPLTSGRQRFPSVLHDYSSLRFCRVAAASERPAIFFFTTDNVITATVWPAILCTNLPPSKALLDPSADLLRSSFIKIADDPNYEEFCIFAWNFILALVVLPLFSPDDDRTDYALKSLKDCLSYVNDKTQDLLEQIYTLHKILFYKPDPKADMEDKLFTDGLLRTTEFFNLYVFNAYLQADDHDDLLKALQPLQKLMIIKKVADVRGSKNLKNYCTWQQNRAVQRAEELIAGIELPALEIEHTEVKKNHVFKNATSQLSSMLMGQEVTKPLLHSILSLRILPSTLGLSINRHEQDPNVLLCHRIVFEHLSELIYLSGIPVGTHDTLADLISDHCTEAQIDHLRKLLDGRKISDPEQLRGILNFTPSSNAIACLQTALNACGLIFAPVKEYMPDKLMRSFREKTLIALPQELFGDEDFTYKLRYAQLALLLCRTCSQGKGVATALAHAISDHPLKYEAALKVLKSVDDGSRTLPQLTESYCENFCNSLQSKEKKYFDFFADCMKVAAETAAENSVFKAYEGARLRRLLSSMHLQQLSPQKPLQQQSVFDSLDSKLISSKLKESREVESVISLLREDEDTTEDRDEDISFNTEEPSAPAQNQATATPSQKSDTASAETVADSKNDALHALAQAIEAQKTDCMDEHEFNGLCLSLGFMSKDAAVEEMNDYCYEHFEEPLFESVPEEGSVYITVELLKNFTS